MSERDRSIVLVTGGSGFIGTNLIGALEGAGARIVNIDSRPPADARQRGHWIEADILDTSKLAEIFASQRPTQVIHLAARTDVDGKTLGDYEVNTRGTSNVLDAAERAGSVRRLIVTSTQFVHQFHGKPMHDQDFAAHTVYGESKVETERLTRAANLSCTWSIVRPTNIWGPWHPRYPAEFWRVIAEGQYLHPGRREVIRSYGYVGNVAWQMMRILESPDALVSKKVFYVGDRPIDLLDWVNGFSRAQTGRDVTIVPRIAVRSLALAGDLFKLVGVRFPITSSRYASMTTDNAADMEQTFAVLGEPPHSLEDGIARTVEWMRQHHPRLVSARIGGSTGAAQA